MDLELRPDWTAFFFEKIPHESLFLLVVSAILSYIPIL